MKLSDLPILDLRSQLPRAAWTLGRNAAKTSATLHYNGPPVTNRTRAGEIHQLIEDAKWHMRKDAFGAGAAGDGIQYPLAVLSDGTICQLRDFDAVLWHCANAGGNETSMAVHLPLGGAQDVTPPQWSSATLLFEALGTTYGFGRAAVLGHKEWPKYQRIKGVLTRVRNSDCPGPVLMTRLNAWRDGNDLTRWRVVYNNANVREGPGTSFPVALGGKAVLKSGQTFMGNNITLGDYIGGSNWWIHRADGVGFIHSSLVHQA